MGLRGAGKSTLARALAGQAGVPCWDTDAALEQRSGRSVSDLLTAEGESVFRQLESEVARGILETATEGIVALGGGAVLDPGTRDRLARWWVCWIDAPDAVLVDRIQASPGSRPSLLDLPPDQEVPRLRQDRSEIYRQLSACSVDTSNSSVMDLARQILVLHDSKGT